MLETNQGEILLELDGDKAPITVDNFLSYVDDGFYNGTIFHRVIAGFMIQGGGFNESMDKKTTNEAIKNEADNGLKNEAGTIAMARTQHPDSATAQFFINTVNNRFLNHGARGAGYAVFGKVIEGMDVVMKISRLPTTSQGMYQDVPKKPVIIIKAYRVAH
ncbi:peptidylprolyl isomerase [Pontibacterium granulatum]|nr:peptidylprolyl isomerase [Pontibacterium granulatum]MDI3325418.1 peptidylprolyl isomerase [Pontibacterium granulatum]